jgi:hypothetical protein
MTTKQGISFIKNKSNKVTIIEANTLKAKPLNEIDRKAPVLHRKIVKQNVTYSDDAFKGCNNFCDEQYGDEERTACYLGCEIKDKASGPGIITLKKNKDISVPFDKWKKEYKKTIPKKSDTLVESSYKEWRPFHTYKKVKDGPRRCKTKYGWCWSSKRCWRLPWPISRTTCIRIPRYGKCGTTCTQKWKTVIDVPGTQVTIPAKWEFCEWNETYKYKESLEGKKLENQSVNSCSMFKTTSKEDIDDEFYKDYSPYKLAESCTAGMNNYKRKDCSVINNKIVCTGNKNGRYLDEDKRKRGEENKKRNKFLYKSDETVEGFTDKCIQTCKGVTIDKINGWERGEGEHHVDCYNCEVKYNPLIRYKKVREDYIDNIIYRAGDDPSGNLQVFLDNLTDKHTSGIKDIERMKGEQDTIVTKNETLFTKLNTMTDSDKNNATINAFLEDMKSKVPSKHIELAIWTGLTIAAGVTVASLISKD